MNTIVPSTIRVGRLRESRSREVAIVSPVEVSSGDIDLLVRKELLDNAVKNHHWVAGKTYLDTLGQWNDNLDR